MNDIEIYKILLEAFNNYTGLKENDLPRYETYQYPQRLGRLSENLIERILRQMGDIELYLKLQAEIFKLAPEQSSILEMRIFAVINWLKDEMDKIKPVTPEKNLLVISMAVWGEQYTKKMLDYNFRSLMAYENLPCLCLEKTVILHLQTDEKTKKTILEAPIVTAMKAQGVIFEFSIIPSGLVNILKDGEIAYWMLGACASLGLEYAKSISAAFHHSYPDIFYSDKFFSECLSLSKTHKAILGSGFRSDESLMIPALSPYLTPLTLSIPAGDLIAHHLNNIHRCAWGNMVNNRPSYWLYPQSFVQMWESEEYFHLNIPHVMGYWLDNSVIKNLPKRFYHTMDSEMDFLIKGENYYMINDDEVYQCELSAPDRQTLFDSYVREDTVSQVIWNAISYRDTAKFFCREMKIKINRKIRPLPINYIPEKHVETMQRQLYNSLMALDPFSGITLATPRTHLGYIFE